MNGIEDKYARLAARLLDSELAASEPPSTDGRRDTIISEMALAIAGKAHRRRTLLAVGVTVAAAAAIVTLIIRSGKPVQTGASASALTVEGAMGTGNLLVRAATAQTLPDLAALVPGDTVRSGEEGSATLATSNGTRLTLSRSSHLRVDQLAPTWRFSLVKGQLQAHVAKLGAGERFVVSTPDSEVEVRGTVFRVVVGNAPLDCRDAVSNSTVEVSEGVVSVRSAGKEVLLHPGESWSAPCAKTQAAAAEAAEATKAHSNLTVPPFIRPSMHHVSAAKIPAAAPAEALRNEPNPSLPMPISRLAEQNDLLSAAMAAERQGQHDIAMRQLDALLAHFPDGPLAESARAEKQRILSAQSQR
jgi:hypothetical protein